MDRAYQVMVLSCDKNADILPYFFQFFRESWKDFDDEIFVNIESVREIDSSFVCRYPTRVYQWDDPWSARFLDCLKEVQKEYVLVLLDDFFLTSEVDEEEIDKCVERMEKDPSIACFNFDYSKSPYISQEFERYVLVDKKAPFRMNLQAALWRKTTLQRFMRKHENPWQFEIWGSKRIRRYSDKVYHLDKNVPKVFTYPRGGVLADGKWNTNETVRFLKDRGIVFDESIRGVFNPGDSRKTEIKHRSFPEKCWQVFKSLI